MRDVLRLLERKEAAILQIKKELEALRLAAAILAEPGDVMQPSSAEPVHTPAPAPKPIATPLRPGEAPRPAKAPTPTSSRPSNANGPAIAEVLRLAREPEARARTVVDLPPAPVPVHISVFPQPENGWIVCDACGHRNPDYLIDCEQCDIPIRLRPER